MKSKLLLGIMITGMVVVTGCSNDTEVVNRDDISNSNTIEQNDTSENNQEVIKSNVKEDTEILPSSNEKNVTKQQDDIKIDSIPVGSYIKYQPSSTSCTVLAEDSGYENNQTYNPSTITSWKVFKNNNGQLDIISSESVGDLTLKGATGYAKAVDTLNKMCKSYVNSTYADSGRNLGYVDGSSVGTIDINTYTNTEFPFSDNHYISDQNIINTEIDIDNDGTTEYPLRHSRDWVWFSSRNLHNYLGDAYAACIYGQYYSDGSIGTNILHISYLDDDREYVYENSFGVRPVISLRHGIKITGGEGTKDNPYTISM